MNPEKFSGRMLRLFRRGQLEEATVISDLRAIGCNITATELDTGLQQRVDFGCHVSGSVDGVINGGLPTAPNKPHVLEIKTHNKKSFDALEKDGVAKTKPMHFTQMQVYMLGLGIDRALYMAVCKDDDRLYAERVRLDREHATKAVERGHRIATADHMPEPCLGASPISANSARITASAGARISQRRSHNAEPAATAPPSQIALGNARNGRPQYH
jgi:hypothetical protein